MSCVFIPVQSLVELQVMALGLKRLFCCLCFGHRTEPRKFSRKDNFHLMMDNGQKLSD